MNDVHLSRPPEDVPELVTEGMSVTVVEPTMTEVRAVARIPGDYSIHDAMVVTSHDVRETDAIITTDETIGGTVPTVWE